MTDAEQKVLDAAREWLVERVPQDVGEKRLAVAVARAWPNDLGVKEHCTCGEAEDCEECPSKAEAEHLVAIWEAAVVAAAR